MIIFGEVMKIIVGGNLVGYVNGIKVNNAVTVTPYSVLDFKDVSQHEITFGATEINTPTRCNGMMDELNIFEQEFTDDQLIKDLMN